MNGAVWCLRIRTPRNFVVALSPSVAESLVVAYFFIVAFSYTVFSMLLLRVTLAVLWIARGKVSAIYKTLFEQQYMSDLKERHKT